ncbi:MAG TPA: exodeoxyribonuclease III, partial [Ornithinibacter sp.]|nr:exodeoxyribonuclease III [Ornithinibacter sp.]
MLLVSANVNGIRAAVRRGGLAWLESAAPDVVTLQEVRASDAELRAALAGSAFEGWHVAHSACTSKGRAGVAVLSRTAPVAVRESLGGPAGDEFVGAGRWVEADVVVGESVVTVASAYVHTGEAGTPRQDEKMRFLAAIGERLTGWAADGRYAVLTGDLNIAHTVDDLKNWKGNRGKA